MRQSREYRSPYAAMLWSMVLPGFGQLYNKDYLVAIVLIVIEIMVNLNSDLNVAIVSSFNGDTNLAHKIDYEWGMFYPSLYGFALWQAFNSAKANNARIDGKVGGIRVYCTGFFIGMVIGMDLGLFWHDHSFIRGRGLTFLDMPVFNGILGGLLLGVIGCLVEKAITRKPKEARQFI